jgi:hypothetical protein
MLVCLPGCACFFSHSFILSVYYIDHLSHFFARKQTKSVFCVLTVYYYILFSLFACNFFVLFWIHLSFLFLAKLCLFVFFNTLRNEIGTSWVWGRGRGRGRGKNKWEMCFRRQDIQILPKINPFFKNAFLKTWKQFLQLFFM